jgi:hypothetical protein
MYVISKILAFVTSVTLFRTATRVDVKDLLHPRPSGSR